MAKKVKKVEKDVTIKTSADTQVLKLTCTVKVLADKVVSLNARIDRIVAAISTAKPVTKDM